MDQNQNYLQDVRRKTLRFAQALDNDNAAQDSSKLSSAAGTQKKYTPEEALKMLNINMTTTNGNDEPDHTDAGEDEDESLFADFRFRSFR